MSSFLFALTLTSIGVNAIPTETEEYVLVKSNACYDAASYTNNYEFSPPYDGEIIGAKLVHQSGAVSCRSSSDGTPFGCDADNGIFIVEMIEIGAGTVYPTGTTEGISSLTSCTSDNECNVHAYNLDGQNSFEGTVEWRDSSNAIQVTTDQSFSLQYGEGCCGKTTSDNHGTSCVDVYFIYVSKAKDCSTFDIDSFLLQCSDEFGANGQELDDVSSAVSGLETRMDGVDTSIAALTSADTALSGRIDAVDGRVDTVDGRADTLESELQALSDRMDFCEERLSHFESAQSVSGFAAVDATQLSNTIEIGNKDVLIYALVILNVACIVGCICCLFMKKQVVVTKGYGVVEYDEDEKIIS